MDIEPAAGVTNRKIVVLHLPIAVPEPERLDAWRENVRLGLASGVVVLGRDSTLEVVELPAAVCSVMIDTERGAALDEPEPDNPAAEAEPLRSRDVAALFDTAAGDEKRAIQGRLRDYRAAHGLGCLEKVGLQNPALAGPPGPGRRCPAGTADRGHRPLPGGVAAGRPGAGRPGTGGRRR